MYYTRDELATKSLAKPRVPVFRKESRVMSKVPLGGCQQWKEGEPEEHLETVVKYWRRNCQKWLVNNILLCSCSVAKQQAEGCDGIFEFNINRYVNVNVYL